VQQIAQQQPQASSAQASESREYNADSSRFTSWTCCLSQDQAGTLEPQSSFRRRGVSSQAQPGTANTLQPRYTSPPSQQGLHPALLSTSCNGLSVSKKMLQEFIFLSSRPCCQLRTCSLTSSPPLKPLSACRVDSQDDCSIFSRYHLLVLPERVTAGKKPPSTTILQSTTSLCFAPLSKHLLQCHCHKIPRQTAMAPAPLAGLHRLLPLVKTRPPTLPAV